LYAFVDCAELKKEGILSHEFAPHDWQEIVRLDEVVSLSHCWTTLFGNCSIEEMIRGYFGEELAFFFSWLVLYTRMLIVPATLGLVIQFSEVFVSKEWKALLALGMTLAVAIWASIFNEVFKRKTHRNVARWGMHGFSAIDLHRSDYDDAVVGSIKIEAWKFISGATAIFFVFAIVAGVTLTQLTRNGMAEHPEDWVFSSFMLRFMDRKHARKLAAKVAAALVTVQIMVLDRLYSKIAIFLTNHQNHRTEQDWHSSLVRKSVGVRLFNALFPFLYVVFAKIHVDGCPKDMGESQCNEELMLELRELVIMFFVTDALLEFAMQIWQKRTVQKAMRDEMQKSHASGEMTYTQIQAKLDEYDGNLDDFMALATQFALVTFFSAPLPELSLLALGANLIKIRLLGDRHLYLLKRVYPRGTEGIGAWQDVFETLGLFAVLVNSGLAFLVLPGLREHMTTVQQVIAVFAAEKLLTLLKGGVDAAIDDVPADIAHATEFNAENLSKLLGVDVDAGPIEVPSEFLQNAAEVLDIGPQQGMHSII
jgi:hypothetical protein